MSANNQSMTRQVEQDRRILELLSQSFPNAAAASTEIINLEAILNLPKGTEHFVADIHGEHEAFQHILKNASGTIKRKIKERYDETLTKEEIRELCTLIYYPEEKLELVTAAEDDLTTWYETTLFRLIEVCRIISSKYTRSKVRKALPQEFAYILEELLHENAEDKDKGDYIHRIIETVISTEQAGNIIKALCHVIQRLAIDQLHILGDVFDRGPGAHLIMDMLLDYKNFDIQWGNHDALWMGAAAGNDCCIMNVLRLSLRFGNMATLEDGYGINLVPLATFAMEQYGDDPCCEFMPKLAENQHAMDEKEQLLLARMHKAVSILQFKLEEQMTEAHPDWVMERIGTLHHIRPEEGVYELDGKTYAMSSCHFPTVDWKQPYALTEAEEDLRRQLHHSFRVSEKLQRHVKCLFDHGCMYAVVNSNLLFHASVPMNEDGTLKEITLKGERYKGLQLMKRIGMIMRSAFTTDTPEAEKKWAKDYFWYLWCGPESPLFDKSRMTTFERYFLTDKALHEEKKGAYYRLRNDPEVCERIMDAFGVKGEHRHIINGHVPVHVAAGETPIKAEGRLMVIDGGFAEPYHKTTGIAGYTLVYHSRGFQLIQHEPFRSTRQAIVNGTDIKSEVQIVEMTGQRMKVRDTDRGRYIMQQISELRELLYAYRHGLLKSRG